MTYFSARHRATTTSVCSDACAIPTSAPRPATNSVRGPPRAYSSATHRTTAATAASTWKHVASSRPGTWSSTNGASRSGRAHRRDHHQYPSPSSAATTTSSRHNVHNKRHTHRLRCHRCPTRPLHGRLQRRLSLPAHRRPRLLQCHGFLLPHRHRPRSGRAVRLRSRPLDKRRPRHPRLPRHGRPRRRPSRPRPHRVHQPSSLVHLHPRLRWSNPCIP